MEKPARISAAEWEIMKLLWQEAPQTAQQVAEKVAHAWTESTVKTLLNRLVRKGALAYEASGKAYRYHPAISREECRAAESASFLNRIFDGSLSPLLVHFVESNKLSDEELAEIERIVRRKREKS